MRKVLLDTGPLVALLSASDASHHICKEVWQELEAPLFTCWPVLTEAAWLLRNHPAKVELLISSGAPELFRILPLDEQDGVRIAAVMKHYRKLKPQLADAALVHLAQREKIETVFTLDKRDFRVYRFSAKRHFQLLP